VTQLSMTYVAMFGDNKGIDGTVMLYYYFEMTVICHIILK